VTKYPLNTSKYLGRQLKLFHICTGVCTSYILEKPRYSLWKLQVVYCVGISETSHKELHYQCAVADTVLTSVSPDSVVSSDSHERQILLSCFDLLSYTFLCILRPRITESSILLISFEKSYEVGRSEERFFLFSFSPQ